MPRSSQRSASLGEGQARLQENGRFALVSVHPGYTVEDIVDSTGFDFDIPDVVPESKEPDADTLALIRGPVAENIRGLYPVFADKVFA